MDSLVGNLKGRFISATLLSVALTATLLSVGCGSSAKHPNAINPFDGDTYDSLTVAHAAISSLRDQVQASHPQYKNAFNTAAASYGAAYTAYASFRLAPASETQVAITVASLTQSIVALEDAIQADLHADPVKVAAIRSAVEKKKAAAFRSHATTNVSLVSILAYLQIADSVALTIPGAAPYAQIAQLAIQAFGAASQAIQNQAGQPIDLSTLTPVPAIA